MGPLWLDAAALGAFVDDLARLELQAVHVLLCGIALGNRTLQEGQRKGKTQMTKIILNTEELFIKDNL